MRKILMNEKGEFRSQGKSDYVRSTAVKMMASMIKKTEKNNEESEVVISNKALQRTSR
jgi:hypothetical protein